jgi:hypothetical protein
MDLIRHAAQAYSLIADRNPSKLTIAACKADPDGTVVAAGICMLRRIGNQLGHDKGKANSLVRFEHKRRRALKVDIAIGCDVVKVTAYVRMSGCGFMRAIAGRAEGGGCAGALLLTKGS